MVTATFPEVSIEGRIFSRVIVGHNPFLGYSYYSEATSRAYEKAFATVEAIAEVIGAALAAGVRGMMLSVDGPAGARVVDAFERACEAHGILIPTIAILDGEFEQHRELLRRANVQVGVLHGQVTDALFRKGTRNFVPEFAEVMARMRKLGLVPGASTHNAGETVSAMAGYDVVVANTPVNKVGWRMCPCPEQVLSALASTDKVIVGMKPLAMGRIPPVEAMGYALSRPEVDIVLAGIATPEEAEETFRVGCRSVVAQAAAR